MGFDQFNSLLNAKTVLGQEDDIDWQKSPQTAGALVAGGYYDFYEGAGEPAANTYPAGSNAFKLATGNNNNPLVGGVAANLITAPNVLAAQSRHLIYAEAVGDVAASTGTIIFFDFLGVYSDFNLATAGSIATGTPVSTADITRYTGATSRTFMYLVSTVAFTGTPPTVVVNYTDGALTSQSTAAQTLITTCPRGRIASAVGFRVPLVTSSGVVAVRSVTHAGGAAPTGKYAVVIGRLLGRVRIDQAQTLAQKSFSDPRASFLFPRLVDNWALGMIYAPNAAPTTPRMSGTIWTAYGTNP